MDNAIRPHPDGTGRVQQRRGGDWIDVQLWLCLRDGHPSVVRFFADDERPPQGAVLVEDAVRLMEDLAAQNRAAKAKGRPAIEAARLGSFEAFVLELLCILEQDDRRRWMLDGIVPPLWSQRGMGDAGDVGDALNVLLTHGLITSQCRHVDETQFFLIPAEVEMTMSSDCAPDRKNEILELLARSWAAKFFHEEQNTTWATVRAGIGASVYLIRRGHELAAFELLEKVLSVARRTGEQAPVLTHLDRLVTASSNPKILQRWEMLKTVS